MLANRLAKYQVFLACCLVALLGGAVHAESNSHRDNITGYWDTFDKDNKLDTTIEIYQVENGEALEAKVVKLHRPQDQGAICTACTDHRKGKPILGMKVITDLAWNARKKGWYGDALDPAAGWEPRLRLRLENNSLKACAHYASDFICVDKASWPRREADEIFLGSLNN